MADNATVRNSEKNLEIQQALDKKAARKKMLNSVIPFFGLIFIVVFFIIVTGGKFVSPDNLGNLVNQGFVLIIIAVGAAFVYSHGGMDFSIGPVSGVAQYVCCAVLIAGYPIWVAILATIVVTVFASSVTASITLLLGVPVFIGSMCVRTSFTGILKTICGSDGAAVNFRAFDFMNSVWLKVVLLIAVIGVGYYLFNYTTVGKYNKAIGGNGRTAQQAGVARKKTIYIAYVIMGICVGIASVFAFFRAGSVTQYTGNGYEFNIMMAIMLGGFPMSGGDRAKISGAIVGALTVVCLSNGLLLWGLDALMVSGVKGVLFVAIVALSYDRSNGKLVS